MIQTAFRLVCQLLSLHRNNDINILSMYAVIKIAFVIISLVGCYFSHKKSVTFVLSYYVDMRQVDPAVVLMGWV